MTLQSVGVNDHVEAKSCHLPKWVKDYRKSWGDQLLVEEWQDDDGVHREKHGWLGRDLVHDRDAPVRVVEYYAKYGSGMHHFPRGGVGTTLTGVAHFTKRAESHQGHCHGGSMCSVLDDVLGWAAFLVTGTCRPWTGFTVNVSSSLIRPIRIDSMLLVQAVITKVVRRKVFVSASIINPEEENAVHATADGLVIINRGVLPENDSVS